MKTERVKGHSSGRGGAIWLMCPWSVAVRVKYAPPLSPCHSLVKMKSKPWQCQCFDDCNVCEGHTYWREGHGVNERSPLLPVALASAPWHTPGMGRWGPPLAGGHHARSSFFHWPSPHPPPRPQLNPTSQHFYKCLGLLPPRLAEISFICLYNGSSSVLNGCCPTSSWQEVPLRM